MIHIKKYENFNYLGKYWKIRTDEPYLSKSLEYIGSKWANNSSALLKRFSFMLSPDWERDPYIFIIAENIKFNTNNTIEEFFNKAWQWDRNENALENYEYMGYLNKVTPEDLANIEIEIDSKKYNL